MLLGQLRHGAGVDAARDALEIATRGGAAASAAPARSVSWRSAPSVTWSSGRWTASRFAGALSDPIEAWLRCGPVSARHTVVAGRTVVADGVPVHGGLEEQLAVHRRVSARLQA